MAMLAPSTSVMVQVPHFLNIENKMSKCNIYMMCLMDHKAVTNLNDPTYFIQLESYPITIFQPRSLLKLAILQRPGYTGALVFSKQIMEHGIS